jgi:hypothetical protein
MKVNIQQDGKKEEFHIINNWEDVTLEKWAQLITSNKKIKGKKAQEAINTIKHLSDIPQNLIEQFNLADISKLLAKISDIQARANSELVNKITVNDKEYGFHPNLEDITLGEWADIEQCITNGMEDNLHKIMAILYRPIIETKGHFYTIEKYSTESKKMREQEFKDMKAVEVENALVFFWLFVNELLKVLPLYLTEKLKTMTTNQAT